MVIRAFSLFTISCAVVGCAVSPDAASESSEKVASPLVEPIGVVFQDCIETVGITLAPMSAVRAHVPSNYTIQGEPFAPVAPFVVRTAHCQHVIVNGFDSGEHSLAQIGVAIVSPDGTGARNTYQLWYYTDSPNLAVAMNRNGIGVEFSGKIAYDHTSCGAGVPCPIHVEPGPNARPSWSLDGTVTEGSVAISLPATSNWWRETPSGSTKMTSSGPNGVVTGTFGSGDFVVTTPENSGLAAAVGSSTITFPILRQFVSFPLTLVTMTTL